MEQFLKEEVRECKDMPYLLVEEETIPRRRNARFLVNPRLFDNDGNLFLKVPIN